MQETSPARWLGLIVGGLLAGTLCGLIPYFFGKKRGQATLGIAGLVSCMVGGLIAGIILALPVAGVFALVIAVRPNPQLPGAPPGAPPAAPPGAGPIG